MNGCQPLHSLSSSLISRRFRRGPLKRILRALKRFSAQRLSVGNHARYLCVVAVRNQQNLSQLPLGLRRLRRKDVPRLRLAPLDFAGASLAEALGRARMGLQLRHFVSFFFFSWKGGIPAIGLKDVEIPPSQGLKQYTVIINFTRPQELSWSPNSAHSATHRTGIAPRSASSAAPWRSPHGRSFRSTGFPPPSRARRTARD